MSKQEIFNKTKESLKEFFVNGVTSKLNLSPEYMSLQGWTKNDGVVPEDSQRVIVMLASGNIAGDTPEKFDWEVNNDLADILFWKYTNGQFASAWSCNEGKCPLEKSVGICVKTREGKTLLGTGEDFDWKILDEPEDILIWILKDVYYQVGYSE